MASNSDKKRKSADIGNSNSNSYHRYKPSLNPQNPKRGGPGILITCETGREFKARREGLQILQQDWEIAKVQSPQEICDETPKNTDTTQSSLSQTTSTDGTRNESNSSSALLDNEIAKLRQDRSKFSSSSPDSPFVIYETGCKGTVLILYQTSCIAPTAPPDVTNETSRKSKYKDTTQTETNFDVDRKGTVPSDERIKVENKNTNEWDPLAVVKRIVEDMKLKSPNYTSSRYISRMIPIQRTCYATIEDISLIVQALLEPIVAARRCNHQSGSGTIGNDNTDAATKATTTFAIQEKRRFCHQIKREALITAVGNIVGAVTKDANHKNEWTVNLSKPDYTIWIDICKTVAGISIIPDIHTSYPRNFNLVEHRISLNTENGSDSEAIR
jgi:THUMP domain